MSLTTPQNTGLLGGPAEVPPAPQRHAKRWIGAGTAIVVAAAAAVVVLANPFASKPSAKGGVQDNGYPTSLTTVERRTLSSQTSVSGTLGYAGSYTVIGQAQGTVTGLPSVGQVITEGQRLYGVDGTPVVLLYGSTPAYRTLSEGRTGADVKELNADLVRLGDATSAELDPSSDVFSPETAVALEKLQAAVGQPKTGVLKLGSAVFLSSALRVTTVTATLGGQAGGQVLTGTSTVHQVSLSLDTSEQSLVKVGDRVKITLPDNQTTPGVVSSVGTVASSGSSGNPTVPVDITPTDPAAASGLDQAPVQVVITNGTAQNVLAVPVDALLALSGGGYAVEVVDASGVHHLVTVQTGLFDNALGMVQVTGSGLAAGERVVVPAL